MSNDAFELLLEIERNSKAFALPLPSQQSMSKIWQGLGFTCDRQNFVVDLNEIKEIIPLGKTTPLPNSAPWFLGISNLRGHVLSLIDLQAFIIDIPLPNSQLSKALVADFDKMTVGFLVEQILGVQHFQQNNVILLENKTALENVSPLDSRFIPYIEAVIQENASLWYVLSLKKISLMPQFFHIISI